MSNKSDKGLEDLDNEIQAPIYYLPLTGCSLGKKGWRWKTLLTALFTSYSTYSLLNPTTVRKQMQNLKIQNVGHAVTK